MKMATNFFMQEIDKIPLLTLEEEKTLATKAFGGDKDAQNKLVNANLRFVVKIANSFHIQDKEDLINEGCLGLIKAAEKFNPEYNVKFISYAVFWIKTYMQRAIREKFTAVKFPATKYAEMKKEEWQFVSLDKTIQKDGKEVSVVSLIEDTKMNTPEENFCKNKEYSDLRNAVNSLKEKEKSVIIKRFGLDGKAPMSLSEIGAEMGYTKERIRQIEVQGLSSLKKRFEHNLHRPDRKLVI